MDLTIAGGMGGKEAVKKLIELDPNVKAIVSSGYSKDPVMAEYKQYGFSGVIAKPFRIKDLSEVVHRVINEPAS
jgi:DNA-binding NarL/FixJ family response regulator